MSYDIDEMTDSRVVFLSILLAIFALRPNLVMIGEML